MSISRSNKSLKTVYVQELFEDTYCNPKLWVAWLCVEYMCIIFLCSSLSSGINSMSANTVQDILVNILTDASQFKKTLVAQLVGNIAVYQT